MLPALDSMNGHLPSGVHTAGWEEIVQRFSGNVQRVHLLGGLRRAIENLERAGCSELLLDGSFVTSKVVPGDFDAAWEPVGVNPVLLDPVLLDFSNGRRAMKAKYGGELFVASAVAEPGVLFRDFFQTDRNGQPKGVVRIVLGGMS